MAGFNVVDLKGLYTALGIPVLVVSRRRPRVNAIRRALLDHVPAGVRKWRLIEQAGPMELVQGLFVQRAGLSLSDAEALLRRFAMTSKIPEPLRTAHLRARLSWAKALTAPEAPLEVWNPVKVSRDK